MDHRFRRDRRICRTNDFCRIRANGRRIVGRGHVVLFQRHGKPAGPSRIGLVTSHRVGNAVRRNRLRRIFREEFRQNSPINLYGFDICVIFREAAKGMRDRDIRIDFHRILQQLGGGEDVRFLSPPPHKTATEEANGRISSF